jgi:hypothetical protein
MVVYFGIMKLYTPHAGISARDLSREGKEVWVPTAVGRRTLVSNLGRLHTEDQGTWSPKAGKHGYPQPYIRGYGRAYLHWLVLCSFEGRQEGRVLRLDKDKMNNRLSNLVWG